MQAKSAAMTAADKVAADKEAAKAFMKNLKK